MANGPKIPGKAPGGSSGPDASILIIILLIAGGLFQLFGGSTANFLGGDSGEARPAFVFEITPETQEISPEEVIEYVLRYENRSARRLTDLRLRVIIPTGATFLPGESDLRFAHENGSVQEIFLNMLSPGERGIVRFAERIEAGKTPRRQTFETTAIAIWRTMEGSEFSQAVVRASTKVAQPALSNRDGDLGEKILATALSPGAGGAFVGFVLVGISVYLFSLYRNGRNKKLTGQFSEIQEEPKIRRRLKDLIQKTSTEDTNMAMLHARETEAEKKEEKKKPTKGDPPMNLPI